MDLSKKHSG